jgi:serine/threonine protein kinase
MSRLSSMTNKKCTKGIRLEDTVKERVETIKKCIDTNIFSSLEFVKIMDSKRGKYILKFSGILKGSKKDVIVKTTIKYFSTRRRYEDKYEELVTEAHYASAMDKSGIGPKVYSIFYTENEDSRGNGFICQYIVMEGMTFDAMDAIEDKYLPEKDKLYVVKEMFRLIDKQIKLGLYCYDIKPHNFVVKVSDNRVKSVKMIDFGLFCTEDLRTLDYKSLYPDDVRTNVYLLLLLFVASVKNVYSEFKKTKEYRKIIKDIDNNMERVWYYSNIDGPFEHNLRHYFKGKKSLNTLLSEIDRYSNK